MTSLSAGAKQPSWMAALQSSTLCAPVGLLLLLTVVISSHLCEVQAKPSDFWCNRQARKNMENKIEGLRTDLVACVGADTLPSPVQLPCVLVHTREWAKKSLQQKHAEVVGALRVFRSGVLGTMNQTTSECQTSLLVRLEHHITNHLAVVDRLRIQNGTVTPSHSAAQNCSSVNTASEVLEQYRKLLRGKLERLAVDLRDDVPKVEHRTTNAKGTCG